MSNNCEDLNLQKDLRFFDHCTRQFIHWLQKDSSPDEIFKEVISNWNNKTVDVKSKVARYEWPFLVIAGILFFSALATFVTGFGIIFYKKFRKTRRHDKSIEISVNKSGTSGFMVILAVVSCFLIITDVCLFLSNNQLSEDLPRARRTLISSIDDLQNFQNNTIQALDHIFRDDFDREVGRSLNQFRALAECSTGGLDSILRKRKVHFNKASESALSALYQTRDTLSRINVTLEELHGISSGLRSELGKMNLYFKEAKRLCSSSQRDARSGNTCKKFFIETEAFSHNEPKKVPNNITDVASRLDAFLKQLNFSSVNEILRSQEDVERHLCEERSGKLREIDKLGNGIKIVRSFALDTVEKYSNQLAERSLSPIKNKIGLALGTDGGIGRYDRNRWWFSFVIILVVLLASLTTLVSLVLKQIEPFISHLPSNISYIVELKTLFPWLPKRLLLSSTIVHLSMVVVVNLCAGMAFLLVSNMALVCEMSSHYDKLDNIFDTSDLLERSKLFAKEKKSFKLFEKISECPEDGTLWAMFNLDEKFDIDDSVDQLNGIPRIATRLFQDDSVFNRKKEKQLQELYKILQEYQKVGLDEINISSLRNQVHNPMFDKSLRKLSEYILSSQPHVKGQKTNLARMSFKMSRSLAKQASVIEDNYVKMYSVASKLLNEYLKRFNKSREQATTSFVNMNDIYVDIADDSIAQTKHQVVDHQIIKTVKVIKTFMKDSMSKVRNDVGKCGPVKRAYNQTVCLFCRDIFRSWNYWWILLLDCGFLLILAIVLCFLTLKRLI